MANGEINIDQVIGLFKDKSHDEQFAVLAMMVKNQQTFCAERCERCNTKYVNANWFKTKLAFVSGFASAVSFIGLGLIARALGFFK